MTADHPAGLDLAAIRADHDYPAGRWCHTCETEIAPCPILRLADVAAAAREWRDAEAAVTALQQRHGSLRNDGPDWERYTAARDRAAVLLGDGGE